jgi:hypothetical protein
MIGWDPLFEVVGYPYHILPPMFGPRASLQPSHSPRHPPIPASPYPTAPTASPTNSFFRGFRRSVTGPRSSFQDFGRERFEVRFGGKVIFEGEVLRTK